MTKPAASTRLRRSLGGGGMLMLTLAALSPAASVYVTGAAILRFAGTGAVAALIVGGIVVMIATALYAELGAAFPHAGGVYHGIGEVLGRRWGLVAMTLGVATAPALLAFVALGLASYVRTVVPGVPPQWIADGAIAAAILVGLMNLRAGLWLTGTLLIVELVALVVLVVAGLGQPVRSLSVVLLHPLAPGPGGTLVAPGIAGLVVASIAGTYACAGSSLAINFAEEVDRPAGTVGRVVLIGGALAVVLVVLPMLAIVIGTPDLAATLHAEAPIAAALGAIVGPAVASVMAVVIALAIFDHVASGLIANSRLIFAAARSVSTRARTLEPLARVDERSGAPGMAALALGLVAMPMTLVGERGLLLFLSSELVTPALMMIAVLVGRRRGQTGHGSFRSPFYPALPVLGLATLLVFLAADLLDPAGAIAISLMIVLAGITAYAVGRARASYAAKQLALVAATAGRDRPGAASRSWRRSRPAARERY